MDHVNEEGISSSDYGGQSCWSTGVLGEDDGVDEAKNRGELLL